MKGNKHMKTMMNIIYPAIAVFAFACFTLPPTVQAQLSPPPDGGYPNQNTAEGDNALFSLTVGGDNTAIGRQALYSNWGGNRNTATGSTTLYSNTYGYENTAIGNLALFANTTAGENTAVGASALQNNAADNSTAVGAYALYNNTTGDDNTAVGFSALASNQTGFGNTAVGVVAVAQTTAPNNTGVGAFALTSTTTGFTNTAVGQAALPANTTGYENVACGAGAGFNLTTGNSNITLGTRAGFDLTTGNSNIDIGNQGVAGESNAIRIGTEGTQKKTFIAGISTTGVMGSALKISSNGQLGVAPSSARFKDEVKPMDKASEAILALEPVTFRYKKEIDSDRTPQFGLVAEDVEKVNPDLVARDADGKVYTVRYEAVNAMLLNEFLKAHRRIEEQDKRIEKLTADLKQQTALIQKVKDKVELNKPAPGTVANR
jgi:Chaperone of endosialidase